MIYIKGKDGDYEVKAEGLGKDIINDMCCVIRIINSAFKEESEQTAIAFQRAIIELQPSIFGEEQTEKVIKIMKEKIKR